MKVLILFLLCFSLSAQELPTKVHIDCIYNIRNNKLEKIHIIPMENKKQENIDWDETLDWQIFKENIKEQLNLVFGIKFKNGNR